MTEKSSSLNSSKENPSTLENEIKLLREEVRALNWLARRKEQEWDSIVRLLKQKEEKLLRTERQHSLGQSAQNQLVRTVQNFSGQNENDNIMSNNDLGPVPEIQKQKFSTTGNCIMINISFGPMCALFYG